MRWRSTPWVLPWALLCVDCSEFPEEVQSAGGSESTSSTTASATSLDTTAATATAGSGTTTTAGADATGSTITATEGADDESTGEPPPSGPPDYDAVRQKSSHNSFQRAEALIDQLVYHRVRSLELDLHTGKLGSGSVDGDWFIYHTDVFDDATSCRLLTDCLADVMTVAQAVPEHEVITLWLDLKDDWESDHNPSDLDAALDLLIGDALWRPAQLIAGCPGAVDVMTAATDPACDWPSVTDLRGKVIVVLTGGGIDPGSVLEAYAQQGSRAFVAPSISSPEALRSPSSQVAIYNTHADDLEAITAARDAGFVVRTWGVDSERQWDAVADAGSNHLAVDAVNFHQDPWTVTHDATGWPFTCMGDCEPAGPEPGFMLGIEADSGDLWDASDNALFAQQDRTAAPAGSWRALVSTPNSWVDDGSKGCLMARAGLDSDAAYFSVCRLGDDMRLRIQYRTNQGSNTARVEHDITPPGVDSESAAWIRLDIDPAGLCATGYGAWQRGDWTEIGTLCFAEPLTHQGITLSSHDSGLVKMLFADLRLDDLVVDADDLTPTLWGGAMGQIFDGPFGP